MITLYHLGVSQSDRIVWIMEELNIPYKLEWFDRGADGMAPKEYRALHPVGTAPIIKDGEVILSESVAIVEYLSQRYGGGALSIHPSKENYPDYLYWMQFNGNAQSVLFAKMVMTPPPSESSQSTGGAAILRREGAYYTHLNNRLGESTYLAGEQFTCADIMAMFNLTTLPMFGARAIDDLPNVIRYVEQLSQRAAYIKAMSIVGPEAKKPTN